MNCFTSSFPHRTFCNCLLLFAAVFAFGVDDLRGQTPPKKADPYQKVSFEAEKRKCTVPTGGEVTALVKNGVELSVTEDWDCDDVPDAYDNCVGMSNPTQADSDRNGIGDACESATMVNTGLSKTGSRRPKARDRRREARDRKLKLRDVDRRSRSSVSGRRDRREDFRSAKSNSRHNKRKK